MTFSTLLPVAILTPALWVSVRALLQSWRARTDLSAAIARSGPEAIGKLRSLVASDDLEGVVEAIRPHLQSLPPQEKAQAEAALLQPSASGRRSYAQAVMAPGFRQTAS